MLHFLFPICEIFFPYNISLKPGRRACLSVSHQETDRFEGTASKQAQVDEKARKVKKVLPTGDWQHQVRNGKTTVKKGGWYCSRALSPSPTNSMSFPNPFLCFFNHNGNEPIFGLVCYLGQDFGNDEIRFDIVRQKEIWKI